MPRGQRCTAILYLGEQKILKILVAKRKISKGKTPGYRTIPRGGKERKRNLSCQEQKKEKKKKIDEFLPEEEQIYQSQGLVSIDRSEAAALLSTTPRLRRRSSTNDLAPLHCMGWVLLRHPDPQSRAGRLSFAVASPSRAPNPVGPRLSLPPNAGAQQYRYIFGRDSDLEAFSHNPPDGSFAPLPYQAST